MTKLIINEYEFQFLTNTWEGVRGAAYNVCREYCVNNGLVNMSKSSKHTIPSEKGFEQITEYGKKLWKNRCENKA